MPPVGFEPTISEGVRPQTYDLNRAAIGTDSHISHDTKYSSTVAFKNFINVALVF